MKLFEMDNGAGKSTTFETFRKNNRFGSLVTSNRLNAGKIMITRAMLQLSFVFEFEHRLWIYQVAGRSIEVLRRQIELVDKPDVVISNTVIDQARQV